MINYGIMFNIFEYSRKSFCLFISIDRLCQSIVERILKDYVNRNVSSRENRQNDDQEHVFITIGPIYPYSTQKLNASENALEQMRSYIKEVRFIFFSFN